MNFNFDLNTRRGWECPKCGRVWSPIITGCGTCNKAKDQLDKLRNTPWDKLGHDDDDEVDYDALYKDVPDIRESE